jgi:hypothetical protein
MGIMPKYKNKEKFLEYFKKNKKYSEYKTSSPKLRRLYDEEMEKFVKNGVIEEASYDDLIWISPTNLVPKANGKVRLVIDTRKLNEEKSSLTPSRQFKYLGWQWDTKDMTVCLTEERRTKALKAVKEIIKKCYRIKTITTQSLAKVIRILSATRTQF